MSEEGTYYVSGARPKDTSFRYFISALLVFLLLCIVIYLALVLGDLARKDDKTEAEIFKEIIDKSASGKLTYIDVPKDTKEASTIRPSKLLTTLAVQTTHRITTAQIYNEENIIPEYNDKKDESTGVPTTTDKIIEIVSSAVTDNQSTESTESIIPKEKNEFESTTKYDIKYTSSDTASYSTDGETQKGKNGFKSTTEYVKYTQSNSISYSTDSKMDDKNEFESTTQYYGKGTTEEVTSDSDESHETTKWPPAMTTEEVDLGITHEIFGDSLTPQQMEISTDKINTTELPTTTEEYLQNTPRNQAKNFQTTTETTKDTEESTSSNYIYSTPLDFSNTSESIPTKVWETTIAYSQSKSNLTSISAQITSESSSETFASTTNLPVAVASVSESEIRGYTTENPKPTTEVYHDLSTDAGDRFGTSEKLILSTDNDPDNNNDLTTGVSRIDTTTTTTLQPTVTTTPAAYITGKTPKPPPLENYCNTTACKKATSSMLHLMNHTADPCHNFYQFACDGQNSHDDPYKEANFNALLDYMGSINGSSEKYLRDFSGFYKSCLEHEREFKFSERIKFVLDYPQFTDLTELFTELILIQAMPVFDIGLDIDIDHKYKFQLTLPGRSPFKVGIDGWSLLEEIRKECLSEQRYSGNVRDVDLNQTYSKYRNCRREKLNETARNFIDNIKPYIQDPLNPIYSDDNLEHLITFLDTIQGLMPSDHKINEDTVNRRYESKTIAELNKKYDIVDWMKLLEGLRFNRGLSKNNFVDIYFPTNMMELFRVLNDTKSHLVPILNLYLQIQLYKNTVIPKERENRENYCMDLSRHLMPDIVTTIVYEPARQKRLHMQNMRVHALFDKLRDNFGDSLNNSKIDKDAQTTILKKLYRIKLGIITTGNYNKTIEHYKNVSLTEGYQENIVKLLRNHRSTIYGLEGTNASASSLLTYFVDHFHPRPVSFYGSEYIVIHPAVFEGRSMDLPEYLRFAKVGLHLSFELAKQFDPTGRRFSTDSYIISQSDGYYKDLEKRTVDLLAIYVGNGYELGEKTFTFQTDPRNFVNEMVADNAAMRLIYDSFKMLKSQNNLPWVADSYPKDKAFFITAAQEYCQRTTASDFMADIYENYRLPSPLKIQNMVSNSREFSDIFGCADGSAMRVNEDMIAQFPYINYEPQEYYTYEDAPTN